MFIKDLSASADLDAAAMTAVSGGQADPQPGPPVTPQDGPFGNGSSPPPSHNYPAFKYNPYHSYYQQSVFPTLMP
jgi:hypothetical protein